ncbi:josephin family protein [Wolffia australiana]
MEGASPSNGGLLYHEVQESKLCAVHCINTVLQGPFFSEFDLAALASDLDRKERQMLMIETELGPIKGVGGFLSEESHNVSMDGDFSIQVLQKALEVWDLLVIPLESPELNKHDAEKESAYICHLQNHWFCIRKVNGEWYNFNSLYPAPEHLTKFYLSAYLDSLRSSGWTIFVVWGNFPKECPIPPSDSLNGFGQWLTPEDAERITKSCSQSSGLNSVEITQEEADFNAAIRASLLGSATYGEGSHDTRAMVEPAASSKWAMKPCSQKDNVSLEGNELSLSLDEDDAKILSAAIEASLANAAEVFAEKSGQGDNGD